MKKEFESIEIPIFQEVGDGVLRSETVSGTAKIEYNVFEENNLDEGANVLLDVLFTNDSGNIDIIGSDISDISFNEKQGDIEKVKNYMLRNVGNTELEEKIYGELY